MEDTSPGDIFAKVRALIRAAHHTLEGGDASVQRLNDALVEFERDAWLRGWNLAWRCEARRHEAAVAKLVLETLGKDRSDGGINLGALKNPEDENGEWLA